MQRKPHSAPLTAQALDQCDRCGADVWTYQTNAGVPVTLDAVPGPVVIDGFGKAFLTLNGDGYREHPCAEPSPRPSGAVIDDEFLWT